jgi:predicted dehydrogenase
MSAYPKPSRKLRLGFVGGGNGGLVGEWHARGVRLSNRWDIVAGALSSDPRKATESARDWFIAPDRSYADAVTMAKAEAARADGIDAVAICTPNHLHHGAAKAFLANGIDVICDKPLTNEISESMELIDLQKTTGLVFGVTHPYAAHPMVRQAKAIIACGDIGEIRQVHVEYLQEWVASADGEFSKGALWRQERAKVGRSSIVGDIGTHAFHLAYFVTGLAITDVRADFHTCTPNRPVEDTAFLNLRYGNGANGTMILSQVAPGNFCGLRLRIFGSTGGLAWDQEKQEYLHISRFGKPEETQVRAAAGTMLPEAARMLHLPAGHAEAISDAWGNLYTEFAVAIDARRHGNALPKGLLDYPTVLDGARGVYFVHATADSHEAGGVWKKCWLAP